MPRKLFPPSVRGGERVKLRRKQLDELAKASKLALSPEQDISLQEVCTDYLISSKFEREAVPGSSAICVYESLITKIGVVITSLSHIMGKETPQNHDVHVELDHQLRSLTPDDTVELVLQRFMNFRRVVVNARDEHVSRFGGRGRPMKNESLRMFIWALADLFEVAGGKAGVTYRSIDNSLSSPFLTWVTKINAFLPLKIRVKSTALPDLVREICRARNKIRGRKKRSGSAT